MKHPEPGDTKRGNIDFIKGDRIFGWAFDASAPCESLEIAIVDGQDLIAKGVAEVYREDLKDAGIGNGRHGFELQMLRTIADGQTHRLILQQAAGGKIVSDPYQVRLDVHWAASIDALQGCTLVGQFRTEQPLAPVLKYTLLVDGSQSSVGEIAGAGGDGLFPFRIRIPDAHFDGMPHLVSVSLLDYPGATVSYIDILRPVFTPWQYLAREASMASSLYAGLPANVTRRLAAFHAKVSALSDVNGWRQISNLDLALRVLNEGYENRNKFPRLALLAADEPEVSVIIPVHNKFALTYHCIASLILAGDRARFEVIVVDDCSDDETAQIDTIVDHVRVVVNSENQGFLRSCNKAAALARGRYVVLLNNDTEVVTGWLDAMLEVFDRFDRVGAVGAKLVYPDGTLQEAGGIVWDNGQPWNLGKGGNPFDPQWNYVRQVDYLSGAALMVSKAVWDEVGGLSDEFAPAYYEDTDLAFKVRAAGYRTFYAPHSEVVHFEGMSHGRDTKSGMKRYQDINAPRFCEKWVDAYAHNGKVGEAVWRNKDRGVRFRALVIDYATPQPDKDAGSYAAVQEMRLLQALGFKLTFVPENLAHFGEYTLRLQKMGVECVHAPFFTSVHDLLRLRGHEFDLVFITRYDVAERHLDAVRQHTKAKVLFNNADLHFLRELRSHLAADATDLSGPLATRDRELALMKKVDAILSYNETEHAVIASHNLRIDNVFKCPWVLPAHGHNTPFEDREGIAFLGGYRHHPNVEAVEYFVEKVMPLLRATGKGIRFHIFGSNVPKGFETHASDDVVIEGYVESVDAVFERCRVFVVPLLSGAGIKGKVLESMSYGVPSVLSPIAMEATGLSHGVSTLVAETPEEWIRSIVELYEDPERWRAISENALALARNNHSFEHGRKLMGSALAYLGFYAGRSGNYAVVK